MKSESELNEELQNEQDQFESMSDNSSVAQEELKQIEVNSQKNYTMTPIIFPESNPKTLKLFSMYGQNNTLIKNLKQQIARLEHLKKQSLYLGQETQQNQIDDSVSQFFLLCQETFERRQHELQNLKKDIKTIDSEQVKILMAKNQNIFNLAETYFEEFKEIIDAKPYQDGLVMLAEERKRAKKKKENNLQDQINKMSLRSVSNDSSMNSKYPGIKIKRDDKARLKYLIRFVTYSQIFSELGDEKSALAHKLHYIIPLSSDRVPTSLAYSRQLNLVLILLQTRTILSFSLGQNQSASLIKDHQSSHKTEQLYPRLVEVPQAIIQLDSKIDIKFCEIRDNKLFILGSDSILRIYEVLLDEKAKFRKFKISNMIYCEVLQKEVGSIVGMSFSKTSPQELLFINNKNHLCKINIAKFKSEILYTYSEKLIDVNSFYLETEDKIFFSTQNFDPIETRLIQKSKLLDSVQKKNQEHGEGKILKICCLQKDQKIYIIRIQKHGLLRGLQQNFESMNPQVQIIQTSIE